MNVREIERSLHAARSWENWETVGPWKHKPELETILVEGLGEVRVIKSSNEDFDDGSHQCEIIFEVTSKDGVRHYRKGGFYQSLWGTEWEGSFTEVNAVHRYVTTWENV